MSTSTPNLRTVKARHVTVGEELLSVELDDGRTISAPLTWYPRLVHATETERNHWRFIGRGEGINWPDLDEDISVENLLSGNPSAESQDSLKAWLQQRVKPSA